MFHHPPIARCTWLFGFLPPTWWGNKRQQFGGEKQPQIRCHSSLVNTPQPFKTHLTFSHIVYRVLQFPPMTAWKLVGWFFGFFLRHCSSSRSWVRMEEADRRDYDPNRATGNGSVNYTLICTLGRGEGEGMWAIVFSLLFCFVLP